MRFDPILKAAVEHHTPAGLVYVGSSESDTAQLWPFTGSRNPIWISSSSNLQEKIKKHPQKYENIIPYFECVSKQVGTLDFYEASLSEFSGNINPVALKPYWQNIKTIKTAKRPVTTLDELCSQNSKAHNAWSSANWLIIDQLAALDTLKGGQVFLPQLDGMIIKVFLPDESPCTPELSTSSKEQISEWLKGHNFTAVVQKDGRHKSFAHVLFVRNWKDEYEGLSIKREDAKRIINEFSSLNEKLKDQLAAKQQTISEQTEEHIRVQESQEKRVSEMDGKLKDVQAQKDAAQAEFLSLSGKLKEQLAARQQVISGLTEDQVRVQESQEKRVSELDGKFKKLQTQKDTAQTAYEEQLNLAQLNLEAKLQSNGKLTEDIKGQQKATLDLESKIESNLERISALSNETKDLKSQLVSVQDMNLRKEKQAELHLQDLEFLREKFKDMKQEYDGNIVLLKSVRAKLLAVVNDKRAGDDETQEPN